MAEKTALGFLDTDALSNFARISKDLPGFFPTIVANSLQFYLC